MDKPGPPRCALPMRPLLVYREGRSAAPVTDRSEIWCHRQRGAMMCPNLPSMTPGYG